MQFNKAERKRSKLRLALCGVSGSGKTTAALRVARGLGGKTALIDTENGSASLYADRFDFDVLELEAPYTPQRFVEAIESAEKAGYDNVIIDSMSHEWVGSGGCLEMNDTLKAKFKNNSFGAWAEVGKQHIRFLEKIVTSRVHIIATVRMKSEHVQDSTTKRVSKVGMKYEMRDDFEYEFTSVFNIDRDSHLAIASKDRTSIFGEDLHNLDEQLGVSLLDWLSSGKNYYMSDENLVELNKILNNLPDDWQDKVRLKYPNFANEADARFDEIKAGLIKIIDKVKTDEAKAEQENQVDDDIALTAIGEYEPNQAGIEADDLRDLEHSQLPSEA